MLWGPILLFEKRKSERRGGSELDRYSGDWDLVLDV